MKKWDVHKYIQIFYFYSQMFQMIKPAIFDHILTQKKNIFFLIYYQNKYTKQ